MTPSHRDELLSAYLDGEVNADERAEVEAWLADDAAARARLEELRAMGERLRAARCRPLGEDLSGAVLAAAERAILTPAPTLRWRDRLTWLRRRGVVWAAAACGVAIVLVLWESRQPARQVVLHQRDQVARRSAAEPQVAMPADLEVGGGLPSAAGRGAAPSPPAGLAGPAPGSKALAEKDFDRRGAIGAAEPRTERMAAAPAPARDAPAASAPPAPAAAVPAAAPTVAAEKPAEAAKANADLADASPLVVELAWTAPDGWERLRRIVKAEEAKAFGAGTGGTSPTAAPAIEGLAARAELRSAKDAAESGNDKVAADDEQAIQIEATGAELAAILKEIKGQSATFRLVDGPSSAGVGGPTAALPDATVGQQPPPGHIADELRERPSREKRQSSAEAVRKYRVRFVRVGQ